MTVGEPEDLEWLKGEMQKRFEIKTQWIGHNEEVEGKVLNRVVRITEEGWEYEADQRHGELIVATLNMSEAKGVTSPGEDPKPWREEEEAELLGPAQAKEYRTLAARANYLALDRPDIQYAVKECCRGMAAPVVGDRRKLKRLARYLLEVPRLVSTFPFQGPQGELTGYSDSDWAGCKRTARSTSGGAVLVGAHCVKTWSSTQKNITLSSAEAELVACVKMSTELLGMVQLLADWGEYCEAKVYVDSNAAIGVTQRKGNGKLRHVKVGMLWVQEKVEENELLIGKVLGTDNPADAMTKNPPGSNIMERMARISQVTRECRAGLSLHVV